MLSAALLAVLCAAGIGGSSHAQEIRRGTPQMKVSAPRAALRGLPREVVVDAGGVESRPLNVRLTIREPEGTLRELAAGTLAEGEDSLALKVTLPSRVTGRLKLVATAQDSGGVVLAVADASLWAISSLWAFVPPLLAIGLALALRQVIPALLFGVLAGAWIRDGFSFKAPLRVLDHDLVRALADTDHLKIVLFTLTLGGMIGLIAKSGGAGGMVQAASRWARTRRSVQSAGWLAGLFVFFDDYANTLVVGPSLRPLTDRLLVSREKLAFIVDATAAPVASVALISTWIGYEVGLISDAIAGTTLAGTDAYSVFLASLPYRFYAWLMLAFVLLVALSGRDFGPMRSAERRAASGAVLRPDSRPLSRTDLIDDARPSSPRQAVWLAAAPVLTVALVTALSLWLTGRAALVEAGSPLGTKSWLTVLFSVRGLGAVLGEASSFDGLLYGAASGVLVVFVASILHRRLALGQAMDAFTEGIRSMTLAMMILTLAWMIGGVCTDLDVSGAALLWIGEGLPVRSMPAITFIVAAAISFATGTSWSTMAVLIPVAVPLADRMALAAEWVTGDVSTLLVAVTGAVLTGAVFGDHCSPISDTTVLSSVACGCDHLDHVRTQLPYAVLVGFVAVAVGDLAVGFGLPVWVSILVGIGILAVFLALFGRCTEPPEEQLLL